MSGGPNFSCLQLGVDDFARSPTVHRLYFLHEYIPPLFLRLNDGCVFLDFRDEVLVQPEVSKHLLNLEDRHAGSYVGHEKRKRREVLLGLATSGFSAHVETRDGGKISNIHCRYPPTPCPLPALVMWF